MNRRSFLKSIGAFSIFPALPAPTVAVAPTLSSAAPVQVFTEHTYQWAEMIVRAHNKCNLGLLQRSLRVDANVAEALRNSLIKNGIVTAQANAYGIHTATKPLYEGAFMNVSDISETSAKLVKKADQIVEKLTNDEEQNDSNYSDLSGYPESEHEDPDPEQSGTDDIKLSQDTQSEQDGKVEPTQAEDVST